MSKPSGKGASPLQSTVAARAQARAQEFERERTRRSRRWAWIGGGVAAVLVVVGIATLVLTRPEAEPPPKSELALQLGCVSCHTADGSRAEGPTWKGLYGSEVTLTDGATVTADDAYLRQAILDPQSQVAAGYPTAMPQVQVTEAQARELVAYIRSLSD